MRKVWKNTQNLYRKYIGQNVVNWKKIHEIKALELYPQFFLELITTQLRFHMVSPQLSLLIIITMQSYKFYLKALQSN